MNAVQALTVDHVHRSLCGSSVDRAREAIVCLIVRVLPEMREMIQDIWHGRIIRSIIHEIDDSFP